MFLKSISSFFIIWDQAQIFWVFLRPELSVGGWETILNIFGGFWLLTHSEVSFNFGIFLIFSGLIFSIGAFGVAFNRKNILLLMVSIEIMFLGINLVFISGYVFLNLEVSLVYALVNLSIAAAEAAIGFGLLMASFRNRPDITVRGFNRLNG
jgi:NADH-quinone oxidoreductase subunit K